MIERYAGRTILVNRQELYENLFLERGVKSITQFETPNFIYPDNKNILKLTLIQHVWKTGDRYFKLSNTYYGNSRDWWIIAKFNNKPTEAHVNYGDVIYVPTPLAVVLSVMKG